MNAGARRGTPVLLALSTAMLAISMDPVVPSLPAIRRTFEADVAATQLVMSGQAFGFAMAQTIVGPLSDRFGRRPLLLAGWTLFVLASIACAFAPTLEALVAARVLQAIGCCGPVVVGRAVVRDLYGVGHTARMLALIMSIGAVPMFLAPLAGGLVEQHLGWRWNFGWLGLAGTAMLAATLAMLPESNHHRDSRATDFGRIVGNYRALLADRRFVGPALVAVGNFSMIFSFLSGASFVLISLAGMSPGAMGFAIGLATLCFAAMSLVSSRLVAHYGTTRLMTAGALIVMPAATIMAGLALARVHTAAAFLAPYFAILVGVGLTNASSVAAAIGPFPRIAGTASSLLGLTQFVIGGMIAYVASRLHDGTPAPTALAVATGAWLILGAVYLLVRRLAPEPPAGR